MFQSISQCAYSRSDLIRIAGTVGTCRCKFFVFFVVILCAAEFHCHFPLQFIIGFITCINDINEGLNEINLMYQNILFTN